MSDVGRILCVDDEPNVLEALKRTLRRSFDVTTAVGPAAGLQALAQQGPFSVIVSDLRMPNMDGVTFLEESRKVDPDAIRILLTGQADFDSAVAAVNRGAVFRFLLKPCAPDVLQDAIGSANEQYNARRKERSLLKHALRPDRPLQTVPVPHVAASPVDRPKAEREALMKFLVVDGSVTMRRIMVNSLQRIGFTEIVEATDSFQAQQAFGPAIRCIITSLDLPHESGLELVRGIRARPDGKEVPILMVAARSARNDVLVAVESGVDSYIVRPFTLEVLKERLEVALRATRRSSTDSSHATLRLGDRVTGYV